MGFITVESDFMNLWMVRRGLPVKWEFVPTDSIATAYTLSSDRAGWWMCPYEVPRSHVVFPLLLQLIQAAWLILSDVLSNRILCPYKEKLSKWGVFIGSMCVGKTALDWQLMSSPQVSYWALGSAKALNEWLDIWHEASGLRSLLSLRLLTPSPSPSLLLLLFTSSHPLLLHFLSLSGFVRPAGPNLRFSTSVSSTESVYPCAVFYVHSNENFKS